MIEQNHVIIGCGDVGKRIAVQLFEGGVKQSSVAGLVHSAESMAKCHELGLAAQRFDLDCFDANVDALNNALCYYLVAPQKEGITDLRSRAFLESLQQQHRAPAKVVLISTTGVYGDCAGEWVDECSATQPQTDRGKRRLDSERQWTLWAQQTDTPLVILRVPGIYAFSRLPFQRIQQKIPVVAAHECGFTNRIHADDLAAICNVAMQNNQPVKQLVQIYNATDGVPGKITEYLQAAAEVLNLPALPEISMAAAQQRLSSGMLSYLSESRKISNQKMLVELNISLRYPNFKDGIKLG